MKKIILILVLLFPFSVNAQLSDAYNTTKEKVKGVIHRNSSPDTDPYSGNKMRRSWEIEAGFNAAFFPSNGSAQLRTDALTVELIHNMSNVFGAFVKYSIQRYEKFEYENSVYDKEWDNYSVIGGFQLYLMPKLRVYAGGGKVYAKDKDGNNPSLGAAIEKGIKYDFPISGYKIVVGYATVDAQMSDDKPDITESTGDQTHSFISVTLSIPFGK